MQYCDPNDKTPRRWALLAAVCYALAVGGSLALFSFDITQVVEKPADTILVDLTEPPAPQPPTPQPKVVPQPRMHEAVAPIEQTAQVAGKDEVTQTPNPKALFKMSKGGMDEPENAGNPYADKGEDKASGTGPGLNPEGFDQLDQGLQGRGLVGALPKPAYPGTKSGKVNIRVTVDAKGYVTSAAYEPKGSTVDDPQLVAAAIAAARKARFMEKRTYVEGGVISYKFNLH